MLESVFLVPQIPQGECDGLRWMTAYTVGFLTAEDRHLGEPTVL